MAFFPGDRVRIIAARDRVGVIANLQTRIYNNETYYPVFFEGYNHRPNYISEETIELYQENFDIVGLLRSGTFGCKETFSRIITHYKILKPLREHIYSLFTSRTEFHPYQFKPVLKYLFSQNKRLLLADEVGLGKTIEAGLILTEERARHEISKILVLCGKKLMTKWREEMLRRFELKFEFIEGRDILRYLENYRQNGHTEKLQAICSLESLRQEDYLRELEATPLPLDFLIIDEAHHLRNPETKSHKIGAILAEAADSVLLLTATPVHLGNENLFNLLKILEPEQFNDLNTFQLRLAANEHIVEAQRILAGKSPVDLNKCVEKLRMLEYTSEKERFINNPLYNNIVKKLEGSDRIGVRQLVELQRGLNDLNMLSYVLNRTRKREAFEKQPMRRPEVIPVVFSEEEKAAYNAIVAIVKMKLKKANKSAVNFGLAMPQRLAASCLPMAIDYYANNLRLEDIIDNSEEWLNEERNEGLVIFSEEQNHESLGKYISLLQEISRKEIPDTKFQALINKLKLLDEVEPNRKIIIFSYFPKTLDYLSDNLTSLGYKNLLIHGKIPSYPQDPLRDERGKRIQRFREDPQIKILLSSEVGSEGLDLECASILFNYDLPWNPMVVEQRIGRLDRFGQKSDAILIFNMSVKDTIEERILERLYERLGIFEKSIGDLEPILGEEVFKLFNELLTSHLTPEEEENRFEQVTQVLEHRLQGMKQLEENGVKFVGFDSFFSDEVRKARDLKRFLSEEEIDVFVKEYLQIAYPGCKLEPAREKGCYELTITDLLIQDAQRFDGAKEENKDKFLHSYYYYEYYRKPMEVTFSSSVAYQNPQVEYINIHHPIVRMACKHYNEHPEQLHPVAKISVRMTKNIKPGNYLYLIYIIEAEGFQAGRSLEPVFVSLDDFQCIPQEISELFLAKIIAEGATFEGQPTIPGENINKALMLAKRQFEERLSSRREELGQANLASIENMRSNIQASFQNRINRKKQLLERALAGNKEERYLRMLRGEIRNLEVNLDSKMKELDVKKNIRYSPEEIAGGFLEVVAEQ